MIRTTLVRSLYGTAALALASAGFGPAAAAVSHPHTVATGSPVAGSTQKDVRGTLLALHRPQRTGDLVLANGSLLPLRFTTAAQERGLQIGARLVVSVSAHGHARFLVRALHANGVNRVARVRGVVSRGVGHESIEILGTNGAAVIVHLPLGSAPHTDRSRSPVPVAPGAEIATAVRVDRDGTLTAMQIVVMKDHVARVEVEGIVRATNPAAGTITLENEDGQRTVVTIGATAATYYVGEHAEVSGAPTGRGASDTQVYVAQAPTATPTASSDDHHGGGGTGCYYTCPATPTTGTTTAQQATPTASSDDHHGGGSGGSGGGTGCYYSCPATATSSATAQALTPTPTPTASSDDHHGGGGGTGCYYACPATATSTAVSTAPNTATVTSTAASTATDTATATSTAASTATDIATVQAPSATPTRDENQRGKPTSTVTPT